MITDFSTFVTGEPRSMNRSTRASMSSRISKLFDRRQDRDESANISQRTSAACEVPIFMSPSSDRLERVQSPQLATSLGAVPNEHARPYTLPASSVYSQSPGQQHQMEFMEEIEEEPVEYPPTLPDLEEGLSVVTSVSSETPVLREKRRKRRRVAETTRQQLAGKKRLSMAFGVTALASVTTYLVLAVTRTAQGLMFHVLCVLFILILAGVFLHSFVRLLMLQRQLRARKVHHQDWHRSESRATSSSSSRSRSASDPFADTLQTKAVEIKDGPEEVVTTTPRGKNKKVVRQPPPVYGNFRESKVRYLQSYSEMLTNNGQRMDPEMVYWHKQSPSPTTPTYDEAMNDVQTAVGYQPPQYISPRRERYPQDGERASNVHPLERERLVGLMGNTMASQRS